MLLAGPGAATAAEGPPSAPSLRQSAARQVARARPLMAQDAAPAAPEAGRSFLRSRKGILTVALMAVVTGYAVYSKFNDRVESPAS
jgi:hypothetical protein